MLVYDITNETSYNNIPNWLQELKTHIQPSTVIMLIGNKCDLEHLRAVRQETANKFAQENGLSFLETSALNASNVDRAFQWLVNEIYQVVNNPTPGGNPAVQTTSGKKELPAPGQTVLTLDPKKQPEKKKKEGGGCCK